MTEPTLRKAYGMKAREERLAWRGPAPALVTMRTSENPTIPAASHDETETVFDAADEMVAFAGDGEVLAEEGFVEENPQEGAPRLDILGAAAQEDLSVAPVTPILGSDGHVQRKQANRSDAKTRNNALLIVLFAAVIALIDAIQVFPDSYDNDIWFILATGREILENGIPYLNPFAIHEGMGIVVQQWLHCVIAYELHSFGGFLALGIWVAALFALLAISLYKVGRIIRGDDFGGEWIVLLIIPAILPMLPYSSVRPHLYTMIAFTWIIGFCELYRRRSQWPYLIALPLIAMVHVNLQAAMAPFDLVIIACYAIPDFLAPFHKRGRLEKVQLAAATYKRLPLLIALVVSAAALLINPYFLDGALYLVNSYGSASYGNYISEMGMLMPASNYMFAMVVVMLAIAAVCIGRKGLKRIDLPLYLLVFGTAFLSFTQVRNMWLCPLFCYMVLVWASAGHSITLFLKRKWNYVVATVLVVAGGVAVAVFGILNAEKLEDIPENNASTPVAAMDYLEEAGVSQEMARVFTQFNTGGYIEYRGYKVNMDPRPELWAPGITGLDFDYYVEYIDMDSGRLYVSDYFEKYDFNVFIVPKRDAFVDELKQSDEYFEISGGEDYRAFILRSAYEMLTGKSIEDAPKPKINNVEKG